MHEEIRAAFDSVHAEPELKGAARAAVARRARQQLQKPARPLGLALATAACAAAVVLGGRWLYFTPTAHISIDVNPSLELGVNRFDRVISVEGWNDDGTALAESVDVTNLSYTDAVEVILSTDTIETLLAQDAVVEIGVIGDDEVRCTRLLEGVQACTAGQQNAHCYRAGTGEVEQAHDCGLSYGKYRAYQQLSALDPTVTPETVQTMTMRQIRDRIAALSGTVSASDTPETPVTVPSPGSCEADPPKEPGHYGAGHHGA